MSVLTKMFPACLRSLSVMLLLASCVMSGSGSAAVYTWDGGGGNNNWSTAGNWVGDTAPVASTTNDLTFSGNTRLSPTVNSGSTYVLSSLTFSADAGLFTIAGGNGSSKIQLGSITNSSSNRQTIGNASSSPILEFTTGGSINTGTSGLLIRSVMQGSGNISKTGSGTLEITNSSLSNTYSGTITTSNGTLLLGASLPNGNVVVDGGATLNTGNAASVSINDLSVTGTLQPGNAVNFGSIEVGGNLTLNSSATSSMAIGESNFDSVSVLGNTIFGGALVIDMEFEPTSFNANLNGDFWNLFSVDTNALTGDFTSVTMTGTYGTVSFSKISADSWQSTYLGNGRQFEFFTSGPRAGILYAVPEPSTIVFAGIGIAMFGWSSWTRRRAQARRKMIEASIA
jgi:autotransporter-associated beta strand protein